jgi:peptidyl-tRNA hydrolase
MVDRKLIAAVAVSAVTTLALARALPLLLKRAGASRRLSSAHPTPASSAAVAGSTTPASSAAVATKRAADDTLVQFVVVRRDLDWPTGSVIAQAAHACVAIAWSSREDAEMQEYMLVPDSMTKVVKECKGERQLLALAEKLRAESVEHKLWVEMPENIPTAIALKPYPRSRVAPLVKKFSLYR